MLAMYSFKGNSSEDLPFSRKDVLTIVRPTKVCVDIHVQYIHLHVASFTLGVYGYFWKKHSCLKFVIPLML